MAPDMLLDLAELQRKGELLLPAQILVAENQDMMVAEGRKDRVADSRATAAATDRPR